jgi:primosomal protein N' (replication factor Y)
MDKRPRLVEVAVDAPLPSPLTYLLPDPMAEEAQTGVRVIVPLGRRKVTGYIIGFPESSDLTKESLKQVISVIDREPLFNPPMLKLFQWAAGYYLAPLAEIIKTALPAGINVASRRLIRITETGNHLIQSINAGQKAGTSNNQELSPQELELLSFFAGKQEIEAHKINAAAGKKISQKAIKSLVRHGLLAEEIALSRPQVREKTERALAIERAPSPEEMERLRRRAPEQARLLMELAQAGHVSIRELRTRYRDPARLGKALSRAGHVKLAEHRVSREPFSMALPTEPPPRKLMPEQASAVKNITKALEGREFQVFMLQGVTGSGKTEVYLRVIEKAVADLRGAIILVPEIALTPQLISRVRQRFADETLAVLHSGLSPGERFDQWRRIKKGEARIAVGARSALFAPVQDLGVIVVDEEQDPAYKQDHGFMYNGRDLAVMRGKEEGAVVVLGSATPSLESSYRSRQEDGYTLLNLPSRVDRRVMPKVELVDLRSPETDKQKKRENENSDDEKTSLFSSIRDRDRLAADELLSGTLREAISETLGHNEQVILFLNRRGVASFLICFDCGNRFVCPNCEVSAVHHRGRAAGKAEGLSGEPVSAGRLLCHYCGHHQPVPEVCPRCRGIRVFPFGVGTEQVEEVVSDAFPGARVMRMDSDIMTGRESYFRCLDRISRREVDIVVGTQMVAKGHDLPGVTLVGVLLADISLNLPDFRAAERTFQMLTQVAGRAGRGDAPGRVIVQTFQPDHYAVRLAVDQDFDKFYERELESRKALFYPPIARLANVRMHGVSAEAVREAAAQMGRTARRRANTKAFRDRVKILGPAVAPIAKIRGRTRWMMIIKAESPQVMSGFLGSLRASLDKRKIARGVKIEIDRDPISLL